MDYGLQMYSVRDITETDLDGAMKAVAEIGYRYVEFAGFFGHSADDVRGMLERYDLKVSGTHTQWQEIAEHYDETVAFHKAIGCRDIIIPAADFGSREKVDAFIDMVNTFQPKLEQDGLRLHYHNHHWDFIPNFFGYEEGFVIHEELQKRTRLNFEIDTYWAFVAKQDPLALLEKLKDRIHVIHLKDGEPDGSKGYSLGQGAAPVAAVRKKAEEMGIFMVVESEGLNPTGPEEAARSLAYLKEIDGKN